MLAVPVLQVIILDRSSATKNKWGPYSARSSYITLGVGRKCHAVGPAVKVPFDFHSINIKKTIPTQI
jgi:hypothetical protein